MTKSLRCPSCAAPLEVEDLYSAFDKCEFCGAGILLSPENYQSNEISFGADDFLLGQARKLKQIKQIAFSGNKIEAIKIYRGTFGTGLKEAKDAVDNIIEGKPVVFTKGQIFSAGNTPVKIGETIEKTLKFAEIQHALRRGNKINAIKIYRETFGVGLKEAKDAVDKMECGSPATSQNFGQFNNSFNKKAHISPASLLAIILSSIVLIILITSVVYVMIRDTR
jgi:ribosomal protein L7/L12